VVSLNHLNGHSYIFIYVYIYIYIYICIYIYITYVSLSFSPYAYLIKSIYILNMGTEELVSISFLIRFDEFTCISFLNCVCSDIYHILNGTLKTKK